MPESNINPPQTSTKTQIKKVDVMGNKQNEKVQGNLPLQDRLAVLVEAKQQKHEKSTTKRHPAVTNVKSNAHPPQPKPSNTTGSTLSGKTNILSSSYDQQEQQKLEELKKKQELLSLQRKQREVVSMADFETEIKELEAISGQGSQNYFTPLFPDNVYDSFGKILSFARELNVQVAAPEYIFVGRQGHGKSQLIEAILGFPICSVGKSSLQQLSTRRPIFLTLINKTSSDEEKESLPKVVFRRDLSIAIPGSERDLEVELSEVPKELEKRQQKASNVPVYLQIESKRCMNVTLIDTPGLEAVNEEQQQQQQPSSTTTSSPQSDGNSATNKSADDKPSSGDIEKTLLSLLRPSNRNIICVEEAQDWGSLKMINFVKRVDPSLTRSTLVFTKFNAHLKQLNATLKLNRYLASQPRDVQCFYITLFSDKVREQCMSIDKFQEKIFQSYKRDKSIVDSLQFDKRFSDNIGLHNLRKFIQQLSWKRYQGDIPEILKKLRHLKRETQLKLQKLQNHLGQMNSAKLRNIATNYVVQFLQIIEKLIGGTAEGNPSVNGQTLLEEKSYGCGEWFDENYQEISVDPEKKQIPYWNSRLYGGQQFERLMAEFKTVVESSEMQDITLDDIATAAGVNKLNNLPNYAWAACDIAQQKVRQTLSILIDQLSKRAVFIMKRLTTVVQKIMESRKKKASQSPLADINTSILDDRAEEFDKFPYFVYHVKDLYNEFVDQTAERVKEKCMDEFYCTATVYWNVNEIQELVKDTQIPTDSSNEEKVKQSVTSLSIKIFQELKERIAKNAMLKFYNFFLIPMQTALWNEIQGTVTCLSDQALSEIFEVGAVKEKLMEDEKELKSILESCVTQEQEFLKSSTVFSHPVQNKSGFEDENVTASSQNSTQKKFGPPPSILS